MSLYRRVQLLLFLIVSAAAAPPASIWHISIDEGPAPAPEDGPPASANAIRDKRYLPAQIASIVGAYLLFVLCIGTAVLLVGRRLRRGALASPRALAMKMMKPMKSDSANAFDPSPISPTSTFTYANTFDPSPISPTSRFPYAKSPSSTLGTREMWPSPQKSDLGYSFQNNKGHNKQASMQSSVATFDESVIEEDKAKNQEELERLYAAVMEHEEPKSTSTLDRSPQQQRPPEFQHLRTSSIAQQSSFPAPNDIKPPDLPNSTSPRKNTRPSPITTHSRASSRSSFGSFGQKRGIRHLPISPPMGSPELVPEYSSRYGEAEPLSPRQYTPGPPPPTPSQRSAYRQEERRDAKTLSPRYPDFSQTSIHPPSRRGSPQTYETQSSLRDPTWQRRTPAPLAIKTQGGHAPTPQPSVHTAPLPFRSQHRNNTDRPPSTIKATVLESKPNHHYVEGPRTGVPMTPYSPYMPFTPLTPMTPSRLVTREERKRKEKDEGRRVATIADRVEEESEIWGDAYP